MLEQPGDAHEGEHHEPDDHDGAKEDRDLGRAVALHAEDEDKDHAGDGDDEVVELVGGDGDAFDGGEDGDGGGDHAVGEEERGTGESEEDEGASPERGLDA